MPDGTPLAVAAKACAGCCWPSSATCAWCRSCWRGNWRACAPRTPCPKASAAPWPSSPATSTRRWPTASASGNSSGNSRTWPSATSSRTRTAGSPACSTKSAATGREGGRPAQDQRTRDTHGPLANRLGIGQLKWELKDRAFRHLEPDTYRRIARLLDEKRGDRERFIDQVKAALGAALAAQGLHAEVAGRPKHIYSIWKKMQKKDVPIGELSDLRAVRVLVDDVAARSAALGVVPALWLPVHSEFATHPPPPQP